jgi:hypothetical protein
MSSAENQTFPFLRLPREIRDKIYKEVLCSFETPQSGAFLGDDLKPLEPTAITHSVETTILLTCTQIHLEA